MAVKRRNVRLVWTRSQSGKSVILIATAAEYDLTIMGASGTTACTWQIRRADGAVFQGMEPTLASTMQTAQTVLERLLRGS